jgi:hypothetical protein
MSINIELGKWYVLNDGQIVGPAKASEFPKKRYYPWELPGCRTSVVTGWTDKGHYFFHGNPSDYDVKREATGEEVLFACAARVNRPGTKYFGTFSNPVSRDTDKGREAAEGHDGTWVAHPGLVAVAKAAFDDKMKDANQIARIAELERKLKNGPLPHRKLFQYKLGAGGVRCVSEQAVEQELATLQGQIELLQRSVEDANKRNELANKRANEANDTLNALRNNWEREVWL